MARNDWVTFNEATYDVMNKVHDLSTGGDTLSVRLITNAATIPAVDTATPRWADFSANECSAGGSYSTGGVALTGVTLAHAAGVTTLDDTVNVLWSAAASSPEDIYYAVLVNNTASNLECLGFLDMGGPVSMIVDDVSITWNTSGILTLTRTA